MLNEHLFDDSIHGFFGKTFPECHEQACIKRLFVFVFFKPNEVLHIWVFADLFNKFAIRVTKAALDVQ